MYILTWIEWTRPKRWKTIDWLIDEFIDGLIEYLHFESKEQRSNDLIESKCFLLFRKTSIDRNPQRKFSILVDHKVVYWLVYRWISRGLMDLDRLFVCLIHWTMDEKNRFYPSNHWLNWPNFPVAKVTRIDQMCPVPMKARPRKDHWLQPSNSNNLLLSHEQDLECFEFDWNWNLSTFSQLLFSINRWQAINNQWN